MDSQPQNMPADLAAHLDYYEQPNAALSSNEGQQEDYEEERHMNEHQNLDQGEDEDQMVE